MVVYVAGRPCGDRGCEHTQRCGQPWKRIRATLLDPRMKEEVALIVTAGVCTGVLPRFTELSCDQSSTFTLADCSLARKWVMLMRSGPTWPGLLCAPCAP